MLLDEPFSALDTGLRASTRKAVARLLGDAGITTILVTHDQGEALRFADQLAVMREARLVQVGDPVEIYRHPVDETTARFLGFAIILPARITDGLSHSPLGVIPVAGAAPNGTAKIMLRPEQLRLTAATAATTDSPGCFGVVTDVEFGGPTCDLTISIETGVAEPAVHAPMRVRYPSNEAPTPGSRIRIGVTGLAHVFDDTVAALQDKLPEPILVA
jgi:iron(III) transport system ATP-binding protein